MRRTFVVLAIFCAINCHLASAAITIATVPVGDPGNAADPANPVLLPGIGSVAYSYNIGTYDVTVGQYTAFLNAVAATDTYGLYNPNMATDLNVAGIQQNGFSGTYTYSVIGSANKPITYVGWGDAARFANWLSNGQPTGGEGNGTTETGSYTLNGATSDAALNIITRNANATWVIPTENEWYKAAYYKPGKNSYYQYPFSSNTEPTSAMPGGTPNTGNFKTDGGLFAVTGSSSYSSSQNYLTDVGAYTTSASPYGAFDMGGDVFQWNETQVDSVRGVRGGPWDITVFANASYGESDSEPSNENDILGFRVAVVPEPSSLILLSLASLGLLWRMNR